MNTKHLMKSNQNLVHYIAQRYRKNVRCYDDLISAGNVGMLKATQRYDSSKGAKFSTYAFYYIQGAMLDLCKMEYKHKNILYYSDAYMNQYVDPNANLVDESLNKSMSYYIDEQIAVLLNLLLPMQRYVIYMKYMKGYSLNAISVRLQIPYKKTKIIHEKALCRLRDLAKSSKIST